MTYYSGVYSIFHRFIKDYVDSLQPDKINRYVYCYNNPINLTDPLGLDPEKKTAEELEHVSASEKKGDTAPLTAGKKDAPLQEGETAGDVKSKRGITDKPKVATIAERQKARDEYEYVGERNKDSVTASERNVDMRKEIADRIKGLVTWAGNDAIAMAIGAGANVGGIRYHGARVVGGLATGDLGMAKQQGLKMRDSIVPRYDRHGGPGWGDPKQKGITPLDNIAFRPHDDRYQSLNPDYLDADKRLLKDMWKLPLKDQPGPFGQAYRVEATAAFVLKLPVDWALRQ